MPKHTEDFTDEERQAILEDAEKIGITDAAQKYDTSWQAIKSWQLKKANGNEIIPRRKRLTPEERDEIWERVKEVGFEQAAAEFNVSKKYLENWRWKFGYKLDTPVKKTADKPSDKKITVKNQELQEKEQPKKTEAFTGIPSSEEILEEERRNKNYSTVHEYSEAPYVSDFSYQSEFDSDIQATNDNTENQEVQEIQENQEIPENQENQEKQELSVRKEIDSLRIENVLLKSKIETLSAQLEKFRVAINSLTQLDIKLMSTD